ncbi:MAG TPA: NYN domain-containing protein [Anaerolineae bacterium]
MPETEDVALFIDFDNVRYSLLNERGKEIEPRELMGKAKKYGRVIAAKAYADFSEHPPEFRRSLEVAGIDVRDIPKGGTIKSRSKKSSPEIAMVLDVFELLLDKPAIDTLVLMTGDRDLIRLVTMVRHRFGKRVVVSGIPETVSRDLAAAADVLDPLVQPIQEPVAPTRLVEQFAEPADAIEISDQELRLIRSIQFHQDRPYRSFNFLAEKAASERNPNRVGDLDTAKTMLETAVREGVLIAGEVDTDMGYSITSYSLNEGHPKVKAALRRAPDANGQKQPTINGGEWSVA